MLWSSWVKHEFIVCDETLGITFWVTYCEKHLWIRAANKNKLVSQLQAVCVRERVHAALCSVHAQKIQFYAFWLITCQFSSLADKKKKPSFTSYSFLLFFLPSSVTQTRVCLLLSRHWDTIAGRPGSDRSFYRIVSVTLTAPYRSRHVWGRLAGPAQEKTPTGGGRRCSSGS